jgi:hypothetical protein
MYGIRPWKLYMNLFANKNNGVVNFYELLKEGRLGA